MGEMQPMIESMIEGRVLQLPSGPMFVRACFAVHTGDYKDLQTQGGFMTQKADYPLRRALLYKADIGNETYEELQMKNRTHHAHLRAIYAAISAPPAERCVLSL